MSIKKKILIIGPTQGTGGVRTHVLHLQNILKTDNSIIKVTRGAPLYYMLYLSYVYRPQIVIYNLSVFRNQILRDILNRSILTSRHRRHIVHLHGGDFGDVRFINNTVGRMMLNAHLRRFDHIFCLTDKQHRFVTDSVSNKACVRRIDNYVPIPETGDFKKPDDVVNLLYLGRLHPLKGAREAIRAVQILDDQRVNLWVIGTGELESEFARLRDPRIVFLGEKTGPEKSRYLSDAHVLLLPSAWPEGLPYVLLEAASYGLALIATPMGAIDRILKHGRNGFLVQPGDVQGIVRRLKELLANRRMLEAMSLSSLQICRENFSITKLKKIYEDLFSQWSFH